MIKRILIVLISNLSLVSLASQTAVPIKNNTNNTIMLNLRYENGQRLAASIPTQKIVSVPLTISPIHEYKLTKIVIKTNHTKQTEFDFNRIIFEHAQAGTIFLLIEPGKPVIVPALTKLGQERYEKGSKRIQEGFKVLGFRTRKTPAEVKKHQEKVKEKVLEASPLPGGVAGLTSQYATPQEEYEFE